MQMHLTLSLKGRKTEQKKWNFLIFWWCILLDTTGIQPNPEIPIQPPWTTVSVELQSCMGWFAAPTLMCRDTGHTLWLWNPIPATSGDTSP